MVRDWDENHQTAEVLSAAHESLSVFTTAVAAIAGYDVPLLAPGVAVALDLQRILAALQHRLEPVAPSEPEV